MCEIAILDPEEESLNRLTRAARTLYESQRSSLGIIAAFNDSDGYDYQVYKAVNPDFNSVRDFIENRMDCYRFFIHGRLATCGEVTVQNAHPLKITDDSVDVEYIMHNGIIPMHEYDKQEHLKCGHEYNTNVDSEVIAHDFGEIPDDVNDAVEMNKYTRQAAFVLFSEDSILIYTGGRYNLSNSVEMSYSHREFGIGRADGGLNYLLVNS